MSHVAEGEAWHCTDANPHATDGIKLMETSLIDGHRVVSREGETAIRVRHGPEPHKRTAPFGVFLRVISVRGEQGQLAKRIGGEKWIYLIKSGEAHQTYASFRHYQLPTSDQSKQQTHPVENHQASQFAHFSPRVAMHTLDALSYGRGIVSLQSMWWVARKISWLRHPIMIPVVVADAALAGVTPTIIADLVMTAVFYVGVSYSLW